MQTIHLENDDYFIEILPDLGGKIRSFFYKPQNFELAARNEKGSYQSADRNTSFSERDASGFDDAFPTINKETIVIHNKKYHYTDHGEIWRSAFKVLNKSNEDVTLLYESSELSYSYTKTYSLTQKGLTVSYHIAHNSEGELPCLWTLHDLVTYREDMEFIYPKGTKAFINASGNDPILGQANSAYLKENELYHFEKVLPKKSNTTKKFYIQGSVQEGYCGYRYPKDKVQCELFYDNDKLPYLGVWVTSGGFRGDYNCALEPSTSYYDSISNALLSDTIVMLEKDKPLDFDITFKMSTIEE